MPCDRCPAAYVVTGAAPGELTVLCRVESTTAGEREKARPVSLVRERESPISLHGLCLGDLDTYAAEAADLGPLATDQQRLASTARFVPGYARCPSYRAERDNRLTAKLVDQPGQRRTHRLSDAA